MTLRSSDLQSDSDLDSIRNSCDVFIKDHLEQWIKSFDNLTYLLELAPYHKAGYYWLREVSQSVIGGHWRSLIRWIRLGLQWRGRLHSYMWMDGLDGMGGIGYHRP